MSDAQRPWVSVIAGAGIVLLYFPAGNNNLFLIFGVLVIVLGLAAERAMFQRVQAARCDLPTSASEA